MRAPRRTVLLSFELAALFGSILAAGAYAGCLSAPDTQATSNGAPAAARGCTPDGGPTPITAPGGYYTSGGTVCTADGQPHLFHGVDRPSLEFLPGGFAIDASDFAKMAGWGANVVRLSLNQDFWLSGAVQYNPYYQQIVEGAVTAAEGQGLDVILDLHWSDQGDLTVPNSRTQGGAGYSGQQPMADVNSLEFWREVATTFKGDGHVFFELYNEPHNITWDVWLHGGSAGGFTAVGMQALYDAVRATGAHNLVIAGGDSWAYDLSAVGPNATFVAGYNVMYATHPYLTSSDMPSGFEGSFGHLETSDFAPVIATEFGDGTTPNCKGDYDREVIQFADAHHMSWTAWAWWVANNSDTDPQGCSFPALLLDWSGTPSVQGVAVKAALGAYPPSPGGIALDASSEAVEAGEAGAVDPGSPGADAGSEAGPGDDAGSADGNDAAPPDGDDAASE